MIGHESADASLSLRPNPATATQGIHKLPVIYGTSTEGAFCHVVSNDESFDVGEEVAGSHVNDVCGTRTACQTEMMHASRDCGLRPARRLERMAAPTNIDISLVKDILLDATGEGRDWTPRSLSLAAGLGPDGVRNILGDRSKNPKMETLAGLARAMGKDVSVFFPKKDVGDTPPSPLFQALQLTVLLPNEGALTEMFEGLLSSIGPDRPMVDVAAQLAQLLPNGLAQLQAGLIDQRSAESTVRVAPAPTRASAGRAPQRRSHI
jgi:hypothetical protein